MSNLRQNFTTPIGRLVWGSMTEPQTKDAEGKPLVIKSGPDAGKPTQRYAFGVAIAKTPADNGHWANTEWGKIIWAVGHAAFPNGQTQRPDFAWKVLDGDSQIPNKKGVKPNTREGYPGHWVLSFSSSFAPRTFNSNGTQAVPPESIKAGYYVQVAGTVDGNDSPNQPGVYLNHSLVALAGYGKEIINGPDPTAVGFGAGPAPAGMSTTPVGGLPPAPGASATPAAPAPLPTPTPAAPAAPVATPTPLPSPTAVQPNTAILNAAAPPPPAATAAVAPPPAAPQMTAKAQHTYEQYRAGGWSDEQLRANGLMV